MTPATNMPAYFQLLFLLIYLDFFPCSDKESFKTLLREEMIRIIFYAREISGMYKVIWKPTSMKCLWCFFKQQILPIIYNNMTNQRGKNLKHLCAEGNCCLIVYK